MRTTLTLVEEKMLEHRYLIFAPKGAKDLRVYYPELMDYPEFSTSVMKNNDMLFCWWYACKTSPLYDLPKAQRLQEAVYMAYSSNAQRIEREEQFSKKFPDNITSGLKRMESFNVSSRVSNYVQTMIVRANCEEMIAKKASEMGPDEMDAWATRTPKLWKLLDETSKAIERGAFGVTAYEETSLKGSDDALRRFRQNNQ